MSKARPQHRIRLAAIIAGLWICSVPAYAQTDDPQATVRDDFVTDDWRFQVSPWLWALSIGGDTTVRGVTTDVDIGFRDILDQLNVGLFLEAEARKSRLGIYANLMFADLGTDADVGTLNIEVDSNVLMVGAGLAYRVGPWALGDGSGAKQPVLVIDPFVGFRYTDLDVDLDIAGGPDVSAGQDWVDPVFGARAILQIDPDWRVTVLGDVGGFGVGSDFTWQAGGLVGYSFGLFAENDTTAAVGYRALGQDFDAGSGSRRFDWDVVYQGPIASLAVRLDGSEGIAPGWGATVSTRGTDPRSRKKGDPRMRTPAILPALAMLAVAPATAQMPENYVIDTAADLVAVCSVDPASDAYVAASNFCEGYGHGAVQYHLIEVQAMPERRLFCAPTPPPTREAVLADFLAWMDRNPAYLPGEALDALFSFLAVTYPCP